MRRRRSLLFLQLEERVAEIRVGALAARKFTPREVAPLGEERVAGDIGVDERQVQPHGAVKGERLLVDALAAADVDVAQPH